MFIYLFVALVNGETDKANHLHLALMVDHIAEVSGNSFRYKIIIKQLEVHHQQYVSRGQNQF